MAELNVQRKENSVWPWILGALLILALLVWFFWGRNDGLDVGSNDGTDSTLVGTAPDNDLTGSAAGTVDGIAVSQYLQFVDNRGSRTGNRAHEYTADGLRQLAAALNEVGGADSVGGVALQPRIDEIRERADAMQQNPNSSEHALQAREAFALAASVIAQLHSTRNANTSATGTPSSERDEALQQAAMAIEPSRPLLDQSGEVEDFFAKTGDALRNMSGPRR